jgi:hypothetical protein
MVYNMLTTQQILGYINRRVAEINNALSTKAETADLSDIYAKSEVDTLISEIELLPGEQGEQGIQGVQGIQGNAGSDASVTKVNVEAVLTGTISSHTHIGTLIFTYNP